MYLIIADSTTDAVLCDTSLRDICRWASITTAKYDLISINHVFDIMPGRSHDPLPNTSRFVSFSWLYAIRSLVVCIPDCAWVHRNPLSYDKNETISFLKVLFPVTKTMIPWSYCPTQFLWYCGGDPTTAATSSNSRSSWLPWSMHADMSHLDPARLNNDANSFGGTRPPRTWCRSLCRTDHLTWSALMLGLTAEQASLNRSQISHEENESQVMMGTLKLWSGDQRFPWYRGCAQFHAAG